MTFSSSVTLTLDYPVSSSLVASLLLSFKVKEFFFKSANIFQSYERISSGTFVFIYVVTFSAVFYTLHVNHFSTSSKIAGLDVAVLLAPSLIRACWSC